MERQPTIKISKRLLRESLSHYPNAEELVSTIEKAATEDFKHRSVLFVKKDKVGKVKVALETVSGDFEKFNGILATERKSINHVGIFSIRSNSKDYTLALEIIEYANDFCRSFNKGQEEGYRMYVKYGLVLIGKKYGLSKFKYYNSKIFEHFESINLLSTDTDQTITNYMYEVWKYQMAKHKAEVPTKLTPEKAVNFIYARQAVESIKGDYKNWVIAQFEHFSFMSVIPELTQFHGETALDRYYSHMNKLKLKLEAEGKSLKVMSREQIVENLKLRADASNS